MEAAVGEIGGEEQDHKEDASETGQVEGGVVRLNSVRRRKAGLESQLIDAARGGQGLV